MSETTKQSFFPGLDRPLAIVDLETTGGSVTRDRITEIGIVEVDAQGVREWSTLINPQVPIPRSIQGLTGITDTMVADAPKFEQMAKQIWQRLKGKTFVAHNVRFDYGFIRNAFADLGFPVSLETLCTVKLSRALYPEHKRHSLETIIQRFGIAVDERHRALADARATYQFLCRAARDRDDEDFMAAVQIQTRRPSLPPGLDPAVIETLPEGPGVYYFYGDNESLLYVGKSINIRKRVMSHFSGDRASGKAMAMCQQIRDIKAQATTGELSALLLESAEIKSKQPLYNRRLRRVSTLYTIQLNETDEPLLRPVITSVSDADRQLKMYGLFPSKKKAQNALVENAQPYGLCDHVIVTSTKINGPCMGYQIKRCKGLCCGDFSTLQHNTRLLDSLGKLALKAWPYDGPVALIENQHTEGGDNAHTAFLLDNWCLLGSQTGQGEPDLQELIDQQDETAVLDRDLYRYLVKAVIKPESDIRIHFID